MSATDGACQGACPAVPAAVPDRREDARRPRPRVHGGGVRWPHRREAACRQLTVRAREHVQQSRPRYPSDEKTRDVLVHAFMAAAVGGNIAALAQLLAEDAVLYADGGGKRPAATAPICGRANIMAFYARIAALRDASAVIDQSERVEINALPGFIVRLDDGVQTIAFEIAGDQIAAIYVVRNPDKLRHLA